MTSLKEQYSELLSLTKQYLLQEYSAKDKILSEPTTYAYFLTQAQQQKRQASPPPEIKQIPPAQSTLPHRSFISSTSPPTSPPAKNPETPTKASSSTVLATAPSSASSRPSTTPPLQTPQASAPSEKPSTQEKGGFKLELPPSPTPVDFSELRKIIQEKFPRLELLDHLPDDSAARRLANLWTQPKEMSRVWILSLNEQPKQRAFLDHLAKALQIHGISAQVDNALKIERDRQWDSLLKSPQLQLVISSNVGFDRLIDLQRVYQHDSKSGLHSLGERRLLLLSDVSFYLKEPSLKASLWQTLQKLLASAPTSL